MQGRYAVGHGSDNAVCGFAEKERRLSARIAAHFACVRGVVATDAIDATNMKKIGRAVDWNGDGGWGAQAGLHGEFSESGQVVQTCSIFQS
jgi:hypothetical protein